MLHAAKTTAGVLLRVGVIGVGVMGSNHARVFAEMPGAQLVGVADPDGAMEIVARALGCKAVSTVDELLDLGVDAVTIAAPTHLHHEIALLCTSSRGIHVSGVVSIGLTVDEGRDITLPPRLAVLMVGHVASIRRCSRSAGAARRGHSLNRHHPRRAVSAPRMSSVGVVIDLAFHDIDLDPLVHRPEDRGRNRSCRAPSRNARTSRCCSFAPPPGCWRISTPTGSRPSARAT